MEQSYGDAGFISAIKLRRCIFMLDSSRSHHERMGKKQNDAFHAIVCNYADFECHVIVEWFCRRSAARGKDLHV